MSTTNVYVLRLEGGNYYVGKSDNVMKRYQDHLDGNGSAWTKKYKPLSVVRVLENVSHFEEDKITKEYMSIYGIDRVRGGAYVELTLDQTQRDSLTREIRAAKDACTRCGKNGHFTKDCQFPKSVTKNVVQANIQKRNTPHKNQECFRCGRLGHYASSCFARRDIEDISIDSDYDSDSDSW